MEWLYTNGAWHNLREWDKPMKAKKSGPPVQDLQLTPAEYKSEGLPGALLSAI